MRKILTIIILSLFLCACNNDSKAIDINSIMAEHDYVIIDVRTEKEYEELHIVDAINIPYDVIDENINIDKNIVIFVYCKSGNRSAIAYKKLKNLGYEVYDLKAISDISLPKE